MEEVAAQHRDHPLLNIGRHSDRRVEQQDGKGDWILAGVLEGFCRTRLVKEEAYHTERRV